MTSSTAAGLRFKRGHGRVTHLLHIDIHIAERGIIIGGGGVELKGMNLSTAHICQYKRVLVEHPSIKRLNIHLCYENAYSGA